MRTVFADAFFYFALANPRDPAHVRAVQFADEFDGPVVTTRWVLTEVADGLARPAILRGLFLGMYEELIGNSRVRIVPFSDELFEAGLDLYARRPDKQWSLTGDHHFEQAGFAALLK